MKFVFKIFIASVMLFSCVGLKAQGDGYEVFVPIAKYLGNGDSEKLSAWFADNLEITIMTTTSSSSRNQARQILKAFFDSYTPRSFTINHKASQAQSKYAVGELIAGGEMFQVTIFVSYCKEHYKIQQLKIDRVR